MFTTIVHEPEGWVLPVKGMKAIIYHWKAKNLRFPMMHNRPLRRVAVTSYYIIINRTLVKNDKKCYIKTSHSSATNNDRTTFYTCISMFKDMENSNKMLFLLYGATIMTKHTYMPLPISIQFCYCA